MNNSTQSDVRLRLLGAGVALSTAIHLTLFVLKTLARVTHGQ